jgi:hypothetical protein
MHEEIMEVLGGALEGEHRDVFAANLERHYSPEDLAADLRQTEALVEGFCVAAEGVSLVALLAMNDSRERIRRARAIVAEQTARA